MKVITFYRYKEIKNPLALVEYLRGVCKGLDLLGRILIGEEGVNGGVSGESKNIEKFKELIQEKFGKLTFRILDCEENAYHRLVVRERDEILKFGEKVNLKESGEYIKPKKLKEWLDDKKDIVLLDARNDYEFKVGKFKNAVVLPIKNFYDFPKEIKRIEHLKEKEIVIYCTGGIRCEKSSAFLKENGFKNVFQLEGGIINYINEFKDEHYEGGCFVFDDRLVFEHGKEISECEICAGKSSKYIDCHNLDCDRLFICCSKCQNKMNKTCSEECMKAERHRNL